MALVDLPDFTAGIAAVRREDVDAVREGVPSKLAALRPLVRGGRMGAVRGLMRDVQTLFELLTDRTYPVPWRTTAAVVFALGYFLMSVDLIPDVIPVVGFFDDALVVAEIVYLLSGDLERFRAHRAARTGAAGTEAGRARVTGPDAARYPAARGTRRPARSIST